MPLTSRNIGRIKIRSKRSYFARNILLPYKKYIRVQETAGLPLLLFALIALVWANLGFLPDYENFWTTKIAFHFGNLDKTETARKWINDFLLPIFFFVAGMEIKREISHGSLSSLKRAAMPAAAALGGMILPALIYLFLNYNGEHLDGWAIPIATDVAFTLSLISLFGRRIPGELVVFALAFTAADDIGGVLIIAFFYTHEFMLTDLVVAGAFFVAILLFKLLGIVSDFVYVFLGIGFFLGIFFSGVHTNIAGVVLGLLVPAAACFETDEFLKQSSRLYERLEELDEPGAVKEFDQNSEKPPGRQLEEEKDHVLGQIEALVAGTQSTVDRLSRKVYPWVSYVVLPVFALANSGVTFSSDILIRSFTHAASLGVLLGLLIGKPLGITLAVWLAGKLNIARLPENIRLSHIFALSIVAGIGFTISLFISHLAFGSEQVIEQAKIAILSASILAAAAGSAYILLKFRK